jgi:hypothetical protein
VLGLADPRALGRHGDHPRTTRECHCAPTSQTEENLTTPETISCLLNWKIIEKVHAQSDRIVKLAAPA